MQFLKESITFGMKFYEYPHIVRVPLPFPKVTS